MARLVEWPTPIGVTSVEWLSGPMARNSGSTTAMDGSEQTFSGIGDVLAFRYRLPPLRGTRARRERGFFLGMHQGANAALVTLVVGDDLTPAEAGLSGPLVNQPWSNGENWSNGRSWKASYPVVGLASTVGLDEGIVRIQDAHWGHNLGLGDPLGFFPFYLGAHFVTEVVDDGEYRVWPPLRADLTANHYATLSPRLAMKTRPGGTAMSRGPSHTEDMSIDLIEVFDYYVRDGAFDG